MPTSQRVRLDSIFVVEGDTTVRLAVRVSFPHEPTQVTMRGVRVVLRLSGGVDATEWFSVSRGVVTRIEVDGVIHMSASIAASDGPVARVKIVQHVTRREVARQHAQ